MNRVSSSIAYRGNDHITKLTAIYGRPDPSAQISIPNIDFTKDNIVVWVPGTSMRGIPLELQRELIKKFGNNVSIAIIDYLATWKFLDSMPHGQSTLMATLDYIRRNKRKGTKVYLAGLSQGSMVISDTLTYSRYYNDVTKAILFGHPSVAGAHQASLGANKVREYNNYMDPATIGLKGEPIKILKSLDSFMRGDVLGALYLLRVAALNPSYIPVLLALGMKHVPFYTPKVVPDPHNYDGRYAEGVDWLIQKSS